MSRSTTAVVLSALVLPGAGQLYLKHYRRGMAWVAVSLVCLWVIVGRVSQQASAVLEKLESGGGTLDANQLSDMIAQTSSHSGSSAATIATWVLAGAWLLGIIDAYRLGKNQV